MLKLLRQAALMAMLVGFGGLCLPSEASAAEFNCTASCSGTFLGAFWQTVDVSSTGSGVINSFLRVDDKPLAEGMNTSYRPTSYDEDTGANYNRNIQLKDVPIININGGNYYEFLLDINEPNGGTKELLALNNVQICISNTGSLPAPTPNGGCAGTLKYTMGTRVTSPSNYTGDSVQLNFDLNAGSGKGDLYMYIPVSTLGVNAFSYVYLFTQFGAVKTGNDSGYEDDGGGYEEWAVRKCGTFNAACLNQQLQTPEPGSMILLGTGLLGLAMAVRRRL